LAADAVCRFYVSLQGDYVCSPARRQKEEKMPMRRAGNLGGEWERARISLCGERKSGEFSGWKRSKSAKKGIYCL
jgi:hypothetical protein